MLRTLDELNSFVGMACFASQQRPELTELATILQRVQHELFNLGSILATLPEDIHPRQPQITATDVEQLEREIDTMNEGFRHCDRLYCPEGRRSILFSTCAARSAGERSGYVSR